MKIVSSYSLKKINLEYVQNENSALKKEVSFFKNKLANEEERNKESLKAWQETEASLRNQLQQLTEKEAQLRKNFEEINNSAEGLKEQLRLVQVHVIFYG